jgi:hypothetical protein
MTTVELEGEPSTERQAGDVRPLQSQSVDEACEAVGVARQSERLRRIRRTP